MPITLKSPKPKARPLRSSSGRVNALQRDTEIQRQVRLHIVVRQATSRGKYVGGIHLRGWWTWIVDIQRTVSAGWGRRKDIIHRRKGVAVGVNGATNVMRVKRDLRLQKRNGLTATSLPKIVQR
jgi:hypothetical protein